MKRKFCVYPLKLGLSLAVAGTALTIAVCLVSIGRFGSAAVFFAVAAIFLLVASLYGRALTVDEEGVTETILGRRLRSLRWEEIREVGVAGDRVFHKNKSQKVGTLFLYFSPKAMSEEDRFDMMLRWPVRDVPFMVYSLERLTAVELVWSGPVTYYNAGDAKYYVTQEGLR